MRISGVQLSHNILNASHLRAQLHEHVDSVLDFKPIALSDIGTVRKFRGYNSYRTCDYTLGGIFMWVDYFNYEYSIIEDTMFIKGISENHPGLVAFSLPLGSMPLSRSVALILHYCRNHGIRPTFSAIPADVAVRVADECGGRVEKLDGWGDYLYDAKSLATLQGKAYSKKRNHVNRFLSENPGYRFEKLDSTNIAEVFDFLAEVDVSEKADRAMAAYELSQCNDVLANLDVYGFDGALLRSQSGDVCAMTLGEVVGDTLYVHVEKMNHDVAGAGETINKLFAENMVSRYAGLRYINREEDMNDEGLRFAKESYHPVAILDKCNVL